MVSLQLIPPFGGESVHHLLMLLLLLSHFSCRKTQSPNHLSMTITIKVNLSIFLFHSFLDKYTIK